MTHSVWGIDHGVEVAKYDKKHVNRVLWADKRLPNTPLGMKGNSGRAKAGRLTSKEALKGQLKGMGVGGVAGAALGAGVSRNAKVGAMYGGAIGTIGGQQVGGVVGRSKGIRESERRGYIKKSLWGVDHGVVSKDAKAKTKKWAAGAGKEIERHPGRAALAGAFPGVHGVIAGKKGHKTRAAAWELGGATVGSVVPGPGSFAGGVAGGYEAHRRGHLKPVKKK